MEETARKLAAARVLAVRGIELNDDPFPVEIRYERENLLKEKNRTYGILYDGHRFAEACADWIPSQERSPRILHLVLTRQLLGTYSESDLRYHARTVYCGFPSFLCLNGLRIAPAKPRKYYLAQQQLQQIGQGKRTDVLDREFADRILSEQDPRINDIAPGYVLQALSHASTGDPFCPDAACMLLDAHRQEEMFAAQLGRRLCETHRKWAENWKGLKMKSEGGAPPA